MAMATPCCYGNFDLQKYFISYSMRRYESIFWLIWCFLVFHVSTGNVSSPCKTRSSHQIELRSFATCRMKVLRSVSRNFRDGLSGPANVFLRVILASEVWIVSILNYLDKIFQDQLGLFGFIGPTKTSPGYIGLNTINNFVVCLCFFLFDGKNHGL